MPKVKKQKEWPRNLTIKQIRDRAQDLECYIDDIQNEYEELDREAKRRKTTIWPK